MSFEMSLAHLSAGVKASDIGRLLKQSIPEDDLLTAYANTLCDPSFDIPLAGLINGSIDALLRVEFEEGIPRFFISDYKSNRLDRDGDELMIHAYSTERMLHEMEHHHYPLQALIYGAAVYRYLRWRAPHIDADAAIAGFAYMFIRGMVGEATPIDVNGNRSGVLTWTAPTGFWSSLSDLFAGGLK
jgi:exodeoxyribonuclease V beta subunit